MIAASPVEADWADSGRLLFDQQLFIQAMLCFDKAGLPLERDVTAAYQARKEAWCLFAKSADEQMWCDPFVKAAEAFLDCATRTDGKQQVACYLRAAECFLQTKDWKLAADAFVSAEEFSLAARSFCRAGCFNDAMKLVEKYKDRIHKDLAEEITEMARSQPSRESRHNGARPYSNNAEEQLGYNLESHDPRNLRTQLVSPEHHGEPSRVASSIHDPLEAIRLLSLSSANLSHQTLAQVLRGLWITLPYGSTESQLNNPAVTSLWEQASSLDQDMLAMFHVIRAREMGKIILLARANSSLYSRPWEALLCFAQCAHDLVSLQDATMSTFLSNSALFLTYRNSLAALARTFQASSPGTQRLLGFEHVQTEVDTASTEETPHGASKFRVFSSSTMFGNVETAIGSVESTPYVLGLTAVVLSKSDFTRLATKTILDKIRSEVQAMHDSANLARYESLEYQWASIYKLYETLVPHFSPLGNVLGVEPAKIPELDRGLEVISSWCQRNLHELEPGHPLQRDFVSQILVSMELAHRVDRQGFATYCPKLHSMKLVEPHPDLLVHIPGFPGPDWSIVHHFIDFYIGREGDTLKRVILATHHIVFQPLMIEAGVLINLFESIGKVIIIQSRWKRYGGHGLLGELLLPQSWVLDIVNHGPQAVQGGWNLDVFFESLYKTMEYMRTYELDTPSEWLVLLPKMQTKGDNIAFSIVRVSWLPGCVVTWYIYTEDLPVTHLEDKIRTTIAHSLMGRGVVHKALCIKFAQADSWHSLELALNRSPLNRGADQLVQLCHSSRNPPPFISQVKRIIYRDEKDLKDQLSLTCAPGQHQGSTANSVAESSTQGQPKLDPADSNRQLEQDKDTKDDALEPK
ncbi:hypothetical protein FRC09_020924 [Ceratobasidium sp. 395]|nr:hypothetical protein FRC09_020924 [Ceratobasidium sp. 395]